MIALELTSKDLTVRCALFGDYVNQVNHFLASGYVEQPVVVIQLAKVKFFRGQVGLQNVMYATQMLFNPNIPEVVEFRRGVNGTQPLFIANEGKVLSLEDDFMRLTRKCTIEELQDNNQEGSFIIFGAIQGIVEDGSWWYSACVCGKGIYPQNGAYYCDFCLKHITNVTPRFKIKITVEDHTGEGIFLLFDRVASYLLKKSCAYLFTEVQRDASLICGDTYPPIFQGLIGKKLLLKVDTKGVPHDTFYGTF
nr:replication protein A 70 kDa DNA-binding subunit C-like [Arachis hypogaea]